MKRLENKTAIVTGGNSGIGKATAILFAKEGADLVLCARRKEALDEVAEECRKYGVQVVTVKADVSSHIGTQKYYSIRNIFRRSHLFHGYNMIFQKFRILRTGINTVLHESGSFRRSRTDHIDTDTFVCIFQSCRLGNGDHSGL